MRFSSRAFLALLGLITATGLHAQAQNAGRNLNVIAVNTTGGQIYRVTFAPPGGSTVIGNTDQSTYVRPQALAFVTNATSNQLDLLVADNQRGTIYRYPGALAPQTPPNPSTGTLVFSAPQSGTGPLAPNSLATDSFGTLFVGSSTAGHSQTSQLWKFPVGTTGSGSFAAPVLLDSNFQSKEVLLELVLAPTDVAGASGVSGGDLILLTTSRVLAYSRASGFTTRITLFSFPNGSPVPGGMDFWPFGNGSTTNYSLLISSSLSGSISQFYFSNPLTAAPGTFYSGLSSPYRVKTLFQAGSPLLFVSENGAILELGANTNGTGTLLATVTQNVTNPQGLAVSNSFTNAASTCLQPGGCNLTGLVAHVPTGVTSLTGNIVEDVCTVNADPRVTFASGAWSCSVPYTPLAGFTCPPGTAAAGGPGCLPVNAVCPGFDDTGTMALADTLCGRSGKSGAGFSMIKTQTITPQFEGAYINNTAVLADGSDPLCGPGAAADGASVWAPLVNEGTLTVYAGSMVDTTTGCGTGHSGSNSLSVFGVGLSLNEAAPEIANGVLRHPFENLGQTRYATLTTTIDALTQANPLYPQWTGSFPNIAANVSLLLWGGNVPPASAAPPGCLDQSWLDFYNATAVDADGSPQWKADLQNAANLLTGADVSGNTTCDSIVINQLASNPAAFMQTPNTTFPNAPIVLNPPGLVRVYWAALYYHLNTRILGNAPSNVWPLPVSVNVLPSAVTLATSTTPGSATLSWNTNGDSGCSLSSSDNTYVNAPLSGPQQALAIPATDSGTIVAYTVSCSAGPTANAVTAYVTVRPPPSISFSPATVFVGTAASLTWNPNGAQGCSASSSPSDPAFTGTKTAPGSLLVTPTAAGAYTYTLACTNPSTTVSATLTAVSPPTLSLSAASAIQGTGATLGWNLNGNSSCSLTSSDGVFSGPLPAANPTAVNPAATGSFPYTVTYTLACTVPAPSSPSTTLTVVQQPTLGVAPSPVTQGHAATLSWNTFGNSGCGWTPQSTDPVFAAAPPPAGTGPSSTQVGATLAPGSYTYTLACAAPTAPVSATLQVVAPTAPLISVSPSSITLGSGSTLAWTIYSGDACTASSSGSDTNPADAFTGMKTVSGSMPLTPNAVGTNTYTLSCTIPATTQSATLTVNPSLARIAISLSGHDFDEVGDSASLNWTLTAATGCVVSGTWPKNSTPQFSPFPVSATGSRSVTFRAVGVYTYTLSCTTPSTPVQTSVTIARGD